MRARTVDQVLPVYPEHRPVLEGPANQARRQVPANLANRRALAALEALSHLSLRSIPGTLAGLEFLSLPVVLAGRPVLRENRTDAKSRSEMIRRFLLLFY